MSVLVASIVKASGQANCSLNNPCGPHGYSRDKTGSIICECKFWWDGTLCDHQTNSGIQVIVLGCLLGGLMILFYGLKIGNMIRRRRKQPKKAEKKEIPYNTKLVDLAIHNAKRSARLSSCIIAICMMIVAAVGLVSKWAIIQPIHDGIVTKYLNNQSIYFIPNNFCDITTYQNFNVITFPVSCFVILLFIIRSQRVSCLRDKLRGYGAPPVPVDFLSHIDRKFAAVVFAVCADELISILQEAFNGGGAKGDGVIVSYLLRLLQVIVMGFRYYPMLAAVYINSVFTLACGTIYAWLDYSMTIVNQGMCRPDFYPRYEDSLDNSTTISDNLNYFGTGSSLVAIQLCTDIPRYLCLAYISVKLPMLLIKRIRRRLRKNMSFEERMKKKLTREERNFFRISNPMSVEMLYVQNLFCSSADQRPPSRSLWARLIPKKIYEWRDDFQFSARVLCVYSSIFLLLYFVAIQACVRVIPQLQFVQKLVQSILDAISIIAIASPSGDTEEAQVDTSNKVIDSLTSNFPVPGLTRPYIVAVFMTLSIITTQLLVMLANIRRNLFQSFRGDDSEIPRRQRSRYISYAAGNIHFAGYFIGYLIWGFILAAVFSALICIAVDAFITFGSVRLVEKILKIIIPSLLFILFKQYLNKLLAQYVFLQHQGDVLALNNRRILMIFIYFNFFLDAFLGFISSIMRLVKSVVGGIVYMCRLDYSPLGRKLETMDGGFSAYCGFIHTECAHRHPVMLVFVSHLYTQIKLKQWAVEERQFDDLSKDAKSPMKSNHSSRYARKWKLLVFLVRNPTIVFFRKAFLNQLHIDEIHALNDVDNNDKKNMQQRLSIYARRMSAARGSIVSETSLNRVQNCRL
ncbi:unnamed protein product [Adineta ricciae]|nr:unnamed protein product [Adineta ricciae]